MKPLAGWVVIWFWVMAGTACQPKGQDQTAIGPETMAKRESAVQDTVSEKNILKRVLASPDHNILAGALRAAGYEDAICNCGPFTFFAPTDGAFNELPEGMVEDLLKPANKKKLQEVLKFHVHIGVIHEPMMEEGMVLDQANNQKVTLTKENDKFLVGGGHIISTILVSNGVIYVVDKGLLPLN